MREAYLAEAVKASMIEEVKLTPELAAADRLDAAENLELYRRLYVQRTFCCGCCMVRWH